MTPLRADALKGHAAMLGFALIISGSFSLGAPAAKLVAPSALNAARFALAIPLLCAAAALGPGLRRDQLGAPWRYLFLGGLLAAYFVLMFEALRLTDPVSTAAVFTLTPIMSALFARLFDGQRISGAMAGALALGGGGALWVIFRGDLDAMLALRFGEGERLYLVGCALHALYTPMVRRLNRGEPPLAFAFWTTLGCGTVIFAWALVEGALAPVDWAALPREAWVAIIYLAIGPTATTFFLLQFAALRLHAGAAMAYGYLVPSFVILWEGVAGRGWVAPVTWIGVAATVAAMAWLLRR
ncbi:DMT family transporter [Rhodovulum sp. DZ06]|uniref:DMT family transporter n=1 Tax=Rhodovulum sp. DZ06 TaxID=3425126 RepID=UPI003D343AF8